MKRNVFLMAIAIVAAFVFISCKEQVKETPVEGTKLATFTEEVKGQNLIGLKIAGENGTVLVAPEYQTVNPKGDILLGMTPEGKLQLINTDGTKISELYFDIEFGDFYWTCTTDRDKKFYYFPSKGVFLGPYEIMTKQLFCKNAGGWNRINAEAQTVFDLPVASIICLKDLKSDSIYYIAPTFKKCQQLYNATGEKVKIFKPKEFARFYSNVKETEKLYGGALVTAEIKDISKHIKK